MLPTVERVSTVWPQAQAMTAVLYAGWMPSFIRTSQKFITQALAGFNEGLVMGDVSHSV
jgi:hypothetical protein